MCLNRETIELGNNIYNYIKSSINTKYAILNDSSLISLIENLAAKITAALISSGKVLVAGNGGSAADAQHFAGELMCKLYKNRASLPVLALTTDSSVITAISNDIDYKYCFSRQIEALGKQGDIFVGISTSGNSENILEALKTAKERGLVTVGLTGAAEGNMDAFCDYLIKIPSYDVPHIQEAHIMVVHILAMLIEESVFKHLN